MKKELIYVAPLRAGIVLGALYGLLGLIFVPIFLLLAILGRGAAFGGILMAILFPVLYAVAGFIGGIIAALVYNLIAKATGGLEFEVRDSAPAA